MQKVNGLGGVFFRASDPVALSHWYEKHLGINGMRADGGEAWVQQEGPTVFAPFPADTDYFGGNQAFMLNFRVSDLDAMLAQLEEHGIRPVKEVLEETGVGRFAWIEDPEGNRIELWEPATQPSTE
jgi:glyoxylase I family protein